MNGLGAVPKAARGRIRRWLGRQRWARIAREFLRDVPLLVRDPPLAVALVRADVGHPQDIATLPLVDRALRVGRSMSLLRRRAELLNAAGELTAAAAAWHEVAQHGDRDATRRARLIEGRLIETDTAWLPSVPERLERLPPVSRTRILHIVKSSVPERWSGFTIRTLQNLRAQRAAGLDPIVVTEIGWPRAIGVTDVVPVVMFDDFAHHRLDRGPEYRPTKIPNDIRLQDTLEDLTPLVRDLRPAILHAHSGYRGGEHALIALALREQFGIPVVYEVRGLFEAVWTSDPRVAERGELYHRRLAQETRILHEVDGVVTISDALASELAGRGIPTTKISVVPNGIDPDALDAPARDPGLRSRLDLEGRFVVGYLGNLDHWREGIEVLVSALAELRSRGRNDVALLIVGDGSRRASLEAHARRLRVADGCRFIGRVPHETVARYYAQMDLFVNPRVDERAARYVTPLKPYEAMAVGVPVLLSDLPALREIVDPPRRGAIAPPGDVAGLASAIESLSDDAELRARLAAAAQEWVLAERTWRSNGPRYRAAYEAIFGPLG